MSLEQKTRTNNKKTTRRNFLKKTLTTITSIILAAYIGISSPACKSYNNPTGPDQPTTYYNATITNLDIFTEQEIGGTVILNGTTQPSGTTFQVPNGEINLDDIRS